jgi:c-di-GMP-binding flagellar brake protein YcgR
MDEKRRYFRIDDNVGISYRVLDETATEEFRCEFNAEDTNEVGKIDREIYALIESQRASNPELSQFFELVNKKLNVMLDQLYVETEVVRSLAHRLRIVNISACGLAFEVFEMLQPGTMLAIDILLQPTGISMRTLARVVGCDKQPGDPAYPTYYLRVEYEQIKPADKELLIQHIMRKQSIELKERREKTGWGQPEA